MYDGAGFARHLFLVVGVVLIRSARADGNTAVVVQQPLRSV